MDTPPQRVPLELDHPAPEQAPKNPTPASPPSSATGSEVTLSPQQREDIQEQVQSALRTCFDPEIPVNIYELGLIYGIDVEASGVVTVRMTLTSPACPAAGSLPPEVQAKASCIAGVTSARVEVVWDPPWTPERMSEAAKLQLGML
jgi:FeS assembly SUF system protein